MFTIIIFVAILSLLVIVHEAGHFFMAKKFGMKVYEFGIGFPPRAVGWYRDAKTKRWIFVRRSSRKDREMKKLGNEEMKGSTSSLKQLKETVGGDERVEEYPDTLWSLNWLPLGGFVKIKGESGEKADESDSFAAKKPWKRIVVLVAGVFMNYLLAAGLLAIGFMIGLPADVTGGIPDDVTIVEPAAVVVQQVLSDSPAKVAGLMMGDKIIEINEIKIENTAQMIELVKGVGSTELSLEIIRVNETINLTATPTVLKDSENELKLGVILADAAVVRYPWYRAIYQGFVGAFFALINIFLAFFILIKNLILGQGLAFEVSGPVGIAAIIGTNARLGFNYLLNITAMISLSLAAINILPIPALDGGRILFVLIEKVIGRPVPMKYEQMAHTIGFVLLMILIVVVTARDILGLVG
jgi:regulator of sigma E protease